MKQILIPFVLGFSSLCSASVCKPVDLHGFRPLFQKTYPLWAQEAVGGDLAYASLSGVQQRNPVLFGYVGHDVDLDELSGLHSGLNIPAYVRDNRETLLVNLINGPQPVGISSNSRFTAFLLNDSKENFLEINRVMRANGVQIIAYMSGLDKDADARKALRDLTNDTVVLARAGGYYPEQAPLDANLKNTDAIIVGNLEMNGLLDSRTQEGPAVSILSPAGEVLLTQFRSGRTEEFIAGGESSTAIATGALANAMEILGTLSPTEAKFLITKTATPLLYTTTHPDRNGAGLINSFKMVEVAKRLVTKGWPAKREVLFEESYYDFSKEAAAALKQANHLLAETNCESKQKGLLLARKSFLYHYTSEAAELLSKTYKQAGLESTANFYSSFYLKGLAQVIRKKIRHHGWTVGAAAVRSSSVLGKEGIAIAKELLQESEFFIRAIGPEILARIGSKEAFDVAKPYLQDPDSWVRSAVVNDSFRFGELGFEFVQSGALDKEYTVRQAAIHSAFHYDRKGFEVLKNALLTDRDEAVRVPAARLMGDYEGAIRADAIKVLENVLQDQYEGVREEAALSLKKLRK